MSGTFLKVAEAARSTPLTVTEGLAPWFRWLIFKKVRPHVTVLVLDIETSLTGRLIQYLAVIIPLRTICTRAAPLLTKIPLGHHAGVLNSCSSSHINKVILRIGIKTILNFENSLPYKLWQDLSIFAPLHHLFLPLSRLFSSCSSSVKSSPLFSKLIAILVQKLTISRYLFHYILRCFFHLQIFHTIQWFN